MNRKDFDAFEGVERISVVQEPPEPRKTAVELRRAVGLYIVATTRLGANPRDRALREDQQTAYEAMYDAAAQPSGASTTALRELLREAIEMVHQTGSLRDHSDPDDKTGWNVHGIETCADPLCVDALAALAAHD